MTYSVVDLCVDTAAAAGVVGGPGRRRSVASAAGRRSQDVSAHTADELRASLHRARRTRLSARLPPAHDL